MYSVLAITLSLLAVCNAVELTEDNWDVETAGKTVFVKFFAPWCGHCQKIKPHWDRIIDEFADSETVLIGDVDCTVHEALCDKIGVQSYPTLKHGDPLSLEKYEGEREYDNLIKFANELKPMCSPVNIGFCDAEKRAVIEKYQAMSAEELDLAINEKVKEVDTVEETLEKALSDLQDEYALVEKLTSAVTKISETPLSVMKAVRAVGASKVNNAGSDEL